MDYVDKQILNILNRNGRMSASDISKQVNLSVPAVSERIRKLEESRVIENYTIHISREKMNLKLMAIVFVTIKTSYQIKPFREEIIHFDEVLECHHIAGEYDYMLKILVEDTSALEAFLSDKLKQMNGVEKSNTIIVLSTLKETGNRMISDEENL